MRRSTFCYAPSGRLSFAIALHFGYNHLTCPKTFRRFTQAEGAEGHCEGMAPIVFWTAAFDWLADATGFDFAAESTGKRFEMGSRLKVAPDLRLTGRAPLPARWKLKHVRIYFAKLTKQYTRGGIRPSNKSEPSKKTN